jgi:peptidoglycan-associated lipoprotein
VVLAGVLAAACASSNKQEPASSDGGGFQESTDPGMGDRSGAGAGGDSFSTVYFAFDDYALNGTAKDILRGNATALNASGGGRLEIQGNCDERGTAEYNLALGKRRAEAAKRYMVDLGVNSTQLTTISFGEENPAVRGSTESAWAKNRRDDFVLR